MIMNEVRNSKLGKYIHEQIEFSYSVKNEIKLLKAILLSHTHHFIYDLFYRNILKEKKIKFTMESYGMDGKILQLLIQGIVETGEYTLEGIAFYTQLPFDVIYDAACGINYHLSVTAWSRIVDLYLQVKPDVAQVLNARLQCMIEKRHLSVSSLVYEN